MSGPEPLGRYARSIEAALGRARGKPVLLSPRDWELLSGWHRDGIPLRVVLEAIDETGRRAALKGSTFASLAYLSRRVEESWQGLLAQRTVDRAGGELPLASRERVLADWEAARARLDPDQPLAEALHAILTRVRAADPFDADAAVDAALEAGAPPDARSTAEAEAEAALAPWKPRMSPEAFTTTRRRAIIDRLRAALGIPRLSIAR